MLTFLCVALLSLFAFTGHAFATEVAVVNVDKLFTESKGGMAAADHLNQVQKTLQAGFDKLAAMHKGKENTPEVQALLIDAEQKLNAQMSVEANAVDAVMNDLLAQAIAAWRKTNDKYDLVVSNRLLLAFGPKTDVTDGVMKEFDKLTPKFAPLPNVTVNSPEAAPAGKK